MNLMNENRDCLYVCYQSIFWFLKFMCILGIASMLVMC